MKFRFAFAALTLATSLSLAQTGTLVVHVDQPGHPISPRFYGLMTEEISHAYDGGLYAEVLSNRSFRDSRETAVHWHRVGSDQTIALTDRQVIDVDSTGVYNDGFWGVPIFPHTRYRLTLAVKGRAKLKATLQSADGSTSFASSTVKAGSDGYQVYETSMTTGDVPLKTLGRFSLATEGGPTVQVQFASLMPPTFHNRPNGNRKDLMEELAELKPSFLRFPGGNYLEGNHINERFDWKKTIGPVWLRAGHQGPWGYRSSDGLGLLEFLEWCEDLKMEPLLAVYAGYSLGQEHVNPGADLQPYVQDALDEIEYVTGPTNSRWGAERARDGHPRPFPLSLVEVGNEDGFDRSGSYDGRFAQFFDAIKAKYPQLQLIATTPVKSRVPDVVDDHYYRSSVAMAQDSTHYDSLPRTGPKIFVGEWASTEGNPTSTFQAAVGDAAWLSGLERDSDLVIMEAYAPLFVNVNRGASQWPTNLIGYDASSSFGSPSFYMQSMFARYTGDRVLPYDLNVSMPPDPFAGPHGGVGVATWRTEAEFKDVEVTVGGKAVKFNPDQAVPKSGTWKVEDGALRQTGAEENSRALFPPEDWTDYTLRLKARKIEGREGFQVMFHMMDSDHGFWFNVGGWDNTRSGVERMIGDDRQMIGRSSRTTVETGRWYDVRIEVQDAVAKCYLDDRLITTVSEKFSVDPIYVAASRVTSSGDVLLKVVNTTDRDIDLNLQLDGLDRVASEAQGEVLVGKRQDMNSVSDPKKVFPKRIVLSDVGPSFAHKFPALSVTVLRLSP